MASIPKQIWERSWSEEIKLEHSMSTRSELLHGAWDLHCHCYPELTLEHKARLDDNDLIAALVSASMAGVLLKSHFWPTPTRAYYLQQANPSVRVLSSITLNQLVGGLDPLAIEAAARLGARMVEFPTWSSQNDQERKGVSNIVRNLMPLRGADDRQGIVVAEKGRLRPEAEDVLDIAKEFSLLVCTGNISPEESLAVCAGVRDRGLRAIFTHPLSGTIRASIEEMHAAADLGAYIEFTCLHMRNPNHPVAPAKMAEMIAQIGPERCIVTTDSFGPMVPPMPDFLEFGLLQLHKGGLSEKRYDS
jgi:Family of unknown function (DUF6282)